MKNQEQLIAQAKSVIQLGEKVLTTETTGPQMKSSIDEQKFHDFRISALSYLGRVFGENSTYCQSFRAEVSQPTASRTRRGIGMITAAERELQGDWLNTTRGSISRDILTDLLRLASLQFELGNSSATIIISGTVLDKVLRDICMGQGVSIHNQLQNKAVAKKGLQLADEAYKKKILDRQHHKKIIAWLALYDAAASGKKEAITMDKAKTMLAGVQDFVGKSKY